MYNFENADNSLKEISEYGKQNPNSLLTDHLPKLCILIIMTEFEKCIKTAMKSFLYSPSTNMAKVLKILDASGKKKSYEFLYSLLHCKDDAGNFLAETEMFFAIMGDSFYKKLTLSYKQYVKSQVKMYERKLASLAPTNDDYTMLSDEMNVIKIVQYSEAEELFLQLKYFRNTLAHNYLDQTPSSDTHNDVIKKYIKAKLFVGALEKAFGFFTVN